MTKEEYSIQYKQITKRRDQCISSLAIKKQMNNVRGRTKLNRTINEMNVKLKELKRTYLQSPTATIASNLNKANTEPYRFLFDRIFSQDKSIKLRYDNKKKNAKDRKIEFDLSLETFTILMSQKQCYYSGYTYKSIEEISIDRVDNNKGYIEGNCVSCLAILNSYKTDFSVWELWGMLERIENGLKPRFKCNLQYNDMKKMVDTMILFEKRKPLHEFKI